MRRGQAGGTMRLLLTWMLRNVPFGSRRVTNGTLGHERPGPQAWLGGSWDCVLLPAFGSPDCVHLGEDNFQGSFVTIVIWIL